MPDDIEQLARDGISALGLDFGALDVVYNERDNKCYLIEANTAPGLEGSTLDLYANAFRSVL